MSAALPPTLVVVNPMSAGGRTGNRWPSIEAALRAARVEVIVHRTRSRGDAIDSVRAAVIEQGVRRVVGVGGDGTLNEVVNGCFDAGGAALASDLVVGLIPSGTGSDLRRTLEIPASPEAAARLLAAGASRAVDVGRVHFGDGSLRHFLNEASCGISAEVVARVDRGKHRGVGPLRKAVFLREAVGALALYRNRDVVITLPGRRFTRRVQQVAVANGRYFGSRMMIAPRARPDDGLFDVVIVGDIGRLAALGAVPRLYRGTHPRMAQVEVVRTPSVSIDPAPGEQAPPPVETDGEPAGMAPAEFRVLPAALRVVAPPRSR